MPNVLAPSPPIDAVAIRPAEPADIPMLQQLIAASARALGRGFYTDAETEAAIAHVFGVDSELIADRTYLVAMSGGTIAGCGGWSRRTTLFGGDAYAGRTGGLLDSARDAARIRAFFVDPVFARRGIGAMLLHACERAAGAAGFRRTTLMATLPGEPFYAVQGYDVDERVTLDLNGTPVAFIAMSRSIVA